MDRVREEGLSYCGNGEPHITDDGYEYLDKRIATNRKAWINKDFDQLPDDIQKDINNHLKNEYVFDPDSDEDLPANLRLLKQSLASLEIQNSHQAQAYLETNFQGTFQSLLAIKKSFLAWKLL